MGTTRRSRYSVRWWEFSDRIGPNLWVVPMSMSVAAVALFGGSRSIDRVWPDAAGLLPHGLVAQTPGDATVVVTALLGAIATALALVFSTSILTFSLASSQLGPRLIRRFMIDPVTQVTLGAFLSTLIFDALTLASIRTGGDRGVPSLTISIALLSSLGCFVLLVVYVHRVASTIQAPNVVASVVADLAGVQRELVEYLPSVRRCEDADEVADTIERARRDGQPLISVRTGYVDLIDHPRLLDVAEANDAVIVLERRPGQFVVEGQAIAHVLPADMDDEAQDAVARGVEIGASRTLRQDLEFAVAQVVEIALRALSPAINDTYTGLTCVDWLGAAISELGQLPASTGAMCSDSDRLLLVVPPLQFARVTKTAFDPIRQAGADNPAVLIRILDAVTSLAFLVRPEHLACLRGHAELVMETAAEADLVSGDLSDVGARHREAMDALSQRS